MLVAVAMRQQRAYLKQARSNTVCFVLLQGSVCALLRIFVFHFLKVLELNLEEDVRFLHYFRPLGFWQ